jgi:sugar phosphate isomerase/epimerase
VKDDAAKDLPGTFRRIAEMGYDGVEFFGEPGTSAAELKDMLAAAKIACCGWHVPWPRLQPEHLEATLAFNKALGNPYLIVPSMGGLSTLAAWRERAAVYNRLAARLARENLRIGYHNHRSEFEPMEGGRPHDVFFDATDAGVIVQLDIGHAAGGGADPLEVLRRHPGRATTVHAKPYSRALGRTDVKAGYRPAIGEDDLPWAEILSVAHHTGGALWYIVEYESDMYSRWEGIERCLKAIRGL